MKTLCVKTNNSNLLNYLLNELKYTKLEDMCFSLNKFKHYNNIIIHYKGSNEDKFYEKISSILSSMVIDQLDYEILKDIITQNYFYFDKSEQDEIFSICFDIMTNGSYKSQNNKFDILYNSFFNYISQNKVIVLGGFITFRIKKYIEILDEIAGIAVNQYIVEKEYLEFISLLRLYINSTPSNFNLVHLIYSNSESILLDENKKIIMISNEIQNTKYLGDISFSGNDYTLNSLLTLMPQKIYIHLVDLHVDEFINTLKKIFENRITICTNCNICTLYKSNLLENNSGNI
ncbi:MAG: putative sporulation protein YtxC [Clostridia bacterium]|nr:putative sporulation protein YtxC [Clostridia bacterium]